MKRKMDPALEKHLKKCQKVALEAALKAGKFLKSKYGKFKNLDRKADRSLVTEADRGAEKIVVKHLRKYFPHDEIMGEESGLFTGSKQAIARDLSSPKRLGSFRWHIDPLDGTTNFVHGFPMFCVSIGLEFENTELVMGVIHNPIYKDTFYAYKGGGAKRNGKPIYVSKNHNVQDAMLTTGFSYRRDAFYERELQSFSRVLRESRAIRRVGSAAMDLALVSCGQFDGFWERALSSWDVAGGICILREAGGTVTKLDGSPYRLGDETILATNGKIHHPMIALLKST